MTPAPAATDNRTLVAARAYVDRGLAVFPLSGKVPLTEHGVKDATRDADLVATWFKTERNIGIAIPPGTIVVDIDPRNGGLASWNEWLDAYGHEHWADVPCAQTGGGGYHYWYQLPDGITRLKKNPAEGIDLLTHGRYVVAPPSITDQKYVWETALPKDLGDLPELPGFIAVLGAVEERPMMLAAPTNGGSVDALAQAAHKMTSWEQLLGRHGWRQVSDTKWRHPESHNPFSATIKHDCLFVYSPNTPFPVTEPGDPHGVTLYSALETLDYNRDRKACLDALKTAGYLDAGPRVATAGSLVPAPKSTTPLAPAAAVPTSDGQIPDDDQDVSRVELDDADGIAPKRARWLWDGRVPVGGLTLLAGREGEGKSTLAIWMMAAVTRGTLEGEYWGEPKDVIIVATEDSTEYTIIPRLMAAGANLKRVFFINMKDPTDTLQLPVHLPDLEMAVARHDVALVVLDPLLSRLSGSLDSHKDADVRKALEPLVKFAERINASLLGLIHLNKSGATDPLLAIMASRAFTAVARSVLFAMVDPENEIQRLLGVVKSNLGRTDLPTLTYTFDPVTVGEDDGPIVATRIVWGEPSDTSIGSALEQPPESKSKLADCAEWLEAYLTTEGGYAPALQVIREGQKVSGNRWDDYLFSRALRKIGGEIQKRGFPAIPFYVHGGMT